MLTDPDQAFLYGLHSEGFLAATSSGGALLHPAVIEPFRVLKASATSADVDLRVASGFRNFERQLSIWNKKASGQLTVLDSNGQPVNLDHLTELEQAFAILRWSALPGASRHHWGTDIDVFDAAVLPSGYQIQLTLEESNTMFGKLHHWLDTQIEGNTAEGFFRPYCMDRGGVAPEPWHLSYAPLAQDFQRAFSIDRLAQILAETDIALKKVILANLDEIYTRFVEVSYSIYPSERV